MNTRRNPVVLHVAAVEFTATRLLRPQLAYLRDSGFDVRVACAPEGDEFSPALVPFGPVRIAFPRRPSPVAAFRAALALRRLVARLDPAVVHFHSPAAAIPGRIAIAFGRHRPKIVYTVHGFLHTWDAPTVRDRLVDAVERLLSRRTDLLLFQSEEDLSHARSGGYRTRLAYLGNGVGEEWFENGRGSSDGDSARHAVFVGRLTREKGLMELLDTAERVDDVRWTLVGDALPSDRDDVRAEVVAATHRLAGRVTWTGMLDPIEIRRTLAGADIFVLPSWREGVPRSVIEAMALGLPVVATDIRGCRELVAVGVNGWLVPPRDAGALAEVMERVAATPKAQLVAMGEVGRLLACERHRESDVFVRILNAYRDLGVTPE